MRALRGKFNLITFNILFIRLITFCTPERSSDNKSQVTPNQKNFLGNSQFGLDHHLNSNLPGKSPSLFLSKWYIT